MIGKLKTALLDNIYSVLKNTPLEKIIKSNDYFYLALQLAAYFGDKDYIKFLCRTKNTPQCVYIEGKPGMMGKSPVYRIVTGRECGLGGCMREVITKLYYCDNMGFTPYITWEDCFYYDKTVTETDNPFEYYFRQTCPMTKDELESYPQVSTFCLPTYFASELNTNGETYQPGDRYIIELGNIVRKYLFFNEKTQNRIDSFIEEFQIDDSVLGVHIRGTDFKKVYVGHPVFVDAEEFFPIIEECVKKYKFKKIFLATDDQNILNKFIRRYRKHLIYSDIFRASGDVGLHSLNRTEDDSTPYESGMEAICDMMGLVACGGIVSGISNIPVCARIYKHSRNEQFICDRVISKGFHKAGISHNEEFARKKGERH